MNTRHQTRHQTEVVVIGAGAVGCNIAYQLAKRGKDVTLVDKGEPGHGTSSFNFGLVWVHSKEPHTYMELNLRSSLLWPGMVEELGEDVSLRQGGGLVLSLSEADYVKKEAMIERQRRSPLFQGRMLSPQEVFEMQPGVSRNIVGASWSPHDGDVNWEKWTMALVRGCKRKGVKFYTHTAVTGIVLDGDNAVRGVQIADGVIAAQHVVNAAGPWAAAVARMVDLEIDLYPERGQVLIAEASPMICPTPMSTVRQDPNGQFYMGTTAEKVGYDWTTTPEAYKSIRETAAKLVPATADLNIVRHFSGLRPMPGDQLPILGPVPHVPGFYIAVSHSGITLGPIHGKIISDLIVEGETDISLDDYDPLRFDARFARPRTSDKGLIVAG